MARLVPSRLLYLAICFLLVTVMSAASTRSKRNANFICPKDCRCYANSTIDTTTVQCKSLNFLAKLSTKESALITSLDLSNAGISTIDYRLKKLMNLQKLNMSGNILTDLRHFPHLPKLTHLSLRSNSIKSFSTKYLPITLRALDISHNDIEELSENILRLHNLRRIDVSGNPFSCDRESLDIRDMLLEREIHIGGHVICNSPAKFKGQNWLHAVDLDDFIKYHEDMQGDMPYEGSGDTLVEVPVGEVQDPVDAFYFDNDTEYSGSGDTDISSTAQPVEEEILVSSKFIPDTRMKNQEEHTTHEPVVSFDSSSSEPNSKYVEEETFDTTTTSNIKVFNAGPPIDAVGESSDIEEDVIATTTSDSKDINAGPAIDGADVSSTNNLGTNIFLVIFLLCLLLLMVYAFKKNKEKKRKSRLNAKRQLEKNVTDTELQPMRPKEKIIDKHNGNSASLPLINAPNGNTKAIEANQYPEEADVIRKQPSLNAEKEPAADMSTPNYPSHSPTHSNAPAYPSNLGVKSVTVRAHEIPDSVPHTPILVNRSRSEDGTHIVVIPTDAPSSQLDE